MSLAASHALRILLTVALFVLLMPGLVTLIIAWSLSSEETSSYYRWESFLHMIGLGYKLGIPAASISGLGMALLSFPLRNRYRLYGAAALIGALSVVASAIIRNGLQDDYVGIAVAGALGATAAVICTALARLFGLQAPREVAAS